DDAKVDSFEVFPEADIAIGKLSNIDLSAIDTYPTIIAPNKLRPGTNLCKLGFPFHEVKATFDEKSSGFKLEPGTLPIPIFPIDGIFY
ncbi:unnamed protein product, partial [marine sediment metagenome]